MTLSYTALDWRFNPHQVDVLGRIIESDPANNLHLARDAKGWTVYYGLQKSSHKLLSDAAKEYERSVIHAKSH
jgi:hypothetical protein